MFLYSLSDHQIISRVHRLTRRERSTTLLVLLHLNEIERRKLHLSLGHSSMFAFCTSALGYSESDAGRRIAAARCIARFPEVYSLLESGAVTIAAISRVASLLTTGNKDGILARIQGRTLDEVDAIVAKYRPRAALPRDRVQPIACTATPQAMPLLESAAELEGAPSPERAPGPSQTACEKSDYSQFGSEYKDLSHSPGERPASAATTGEVSSIDTCVRVSFTARKQFNAKVQRVRILAAHRLPRRASLEDIFEMLMDEFLERKDPVKRRGRREKRASRLTGRDASPTVADVGASINPRHIPASVRDEVFHRDDGRCTFVGVDGRRCGSTHVLQVDHIRPVALGGTGTRDNLRLLCAYHNRFEAERVLGQRG